MEKLLSNLSINKQGELCQVVIFENKTSQEYHFRGVGEHPYLGIFFTVRERKIL